MNARHTWPWLAAASLCLSGCASVPATRIELPTPHGKFVINSPKENTWKGVRFEFDPATGRIVAEIKEVNSQNSADVIAAVAQANATMANAVIAGGVKAIELGAAAAAKGATGGIAP